MLLCLHTNHERGDDMLYQLLFILFVCISNCMFGAEGATEIKENGGMSLIRIIRFYIGANLKYIAACMILWPYIEN